VVFIAFVQTIRARMRKSNCCTHFSKTENNESTPKIMKFCPTCQTRYDEEILRFCTKDGTPLIEEKPPNFTALPSESSIDDPGEETIVRRKPAVNPPPQTPPHPQEKPPAPRIVIPTSQERPQQQVRANTTAAYQAPPQKTNTAKVVVLTVLGTLVILAGAVGVFWFLQSDTPGNTNTNVNSVNSNVNTNPPTNLGIDAFNFNVGNNINTNVNTNTNVNVRTPTPTPKPSPTPTPTPRPTPRANTNVSTDEATPLPSETRPTPLPTVTPRPTETVAPPVNRPVNVGVLNGRAVNLPTPAYPSSAKAMRASGRVTVQVSVDEDGGVTSAKAVSGHPLLRQAAEAAARQSRFNPIRVNNQTVSATGILVYNFIY
jgi:TonB family protein